jgi:YfiH family protein
MNMVSGLKDGNFVLPGKSVTHGFFGRQGGVSSGLYNSLNCGVGTQDDPANVQENRARVLASVGGNALVTLKQVHSATCLYTDAAFAHRPEADAVVTDVPGLAIGVLTADCGPVLFYGETAEGKPVIGAAHAGWGGALKGVLESTVKTMLGRGARIETISASLGPCIGQKSYEVQNDFALPFLEQDPANEHFFKAARREGHLMFDLPGYIASRLAQAGVQHVSITGIDTYSAEEDYFSYRRTTHRAEKDYGRQVSVIAIRP